MAQAYGTDAAGQGKSYSTYVNGNQQRWESQYGTPAPGTSGYVSTVTSGNDGGTPEQPDDGSGGGNGGGGYYYGGGGSSAKAKYTAAVLPSATSQADYINSMYEANQAAKQAALEKSYNQNVMALDQSAEKIPATYNQQANAAAAQYAINRANMNERMNANGINTGAGSQSALAMNNAYQASLNSINLAKANALKDVENKRALYTKEYQDAIAAAIAENDAARAQALYQEAKRVDDSIVETAINQATENYRAFTANR